jgi:hypothetical protein
MQEHINPFCRGNILDGVAGQKRRILEWPISFRQRLWAARMVDRSLADRADTPKET